MKSPAIILLGALGRLGRAILSAIEEDPGVRLAAAMVERQSLEQGRTLAAHGFKDFARVPLCTTDAEPFPDGDVVIDATLASSVASNLRRVMQKRLPYVLAVTGLSKTTEKLVLEISRRIPILVAPNLSLGVAVLTELVSWTAGRLPGCEIEITECHHRHKRDAPSGTALALARAAQEPRSGAGGKRARSPIPIHSLRGGDVVGEHRVHFLAEGERLELAHIATSRAIFARGALRAARFILDQRPGIYGMRDVLRGGR